MPTSQRSARQVHAALLAALEQLRRVERCAVIEFSEIMRRKLYRRLGHASIQAYAAEALGFSDNKIGQFIRLADSIDKLPELKDAIIQNKLTWTKARSVARVASKSTEKQWIEVASESSSRELEAKIRSARKQSGDSRPQLFAEEHRGALPAPKSQVTFSLPPELKAKFDACMEHLRKMGDRRSREELLIEAFSLLAENQPLSRGTRSTGAHEQKEIVLVPRGTQNPPYQIVIYRCESCGGGRLPDGSAVDEATISAATCDCRLHDGVKPNRASVPPLRRRQVLVRDGHRCSVAGCGNTRFLEVHHVVPREMGGDKSPENLVSLCGSCHRLAHRQPQLLNSGAARAAAG